MRRWIKQATLLFVFVLVAAACGQKPGVHIRGTQTGAGLAEGDQLAEAVDESGQPLAVGAEGSAEGTSGGSAGGSGPSTTTKRTGGTSSGPATVASGPGDKTGVSDTEILIGVHGPVTGAAAAPLTDIENGIHLLKQYLDDKKIKINGRTTRSFFRDDQYNPSHAVSVCREMAEVKKVFMLVGVGGTDQIVACARYARGKGIPYLSAGVTETELNTFKNYFAFSATYPDQAKPLVSMIKNFTAPNGGKIYLDRCKDDGSGCIKNPVTGIDNPPGGYGATPKVAMIYSDTEGFLDARDAFEKEFTAVFGTKPLLVPITKFNLSAGDATQQMTTFKGAGIDIVYALTSPTNWLELLSRAASQQYFARWVGVGVTKGLDLVANLACNSTRRPAFEGSLFFSPYFSVRHPDASQFKEAWDAYGTTDDPYTNHDLAFGVWGGSIVQAGLLHAGGRNLTRQGFIAAAESLKNFKWPAQATGIQMKDLFTSLNYSPNNHFGGQQVHLLWGNCGGTGFWDYFPNQGHFVTEF